MKKVYRKCPVFFDLFFVAAFMLSLGGYAIAAPFEVAVPLNDSASLFTLLSVLFGGEKAAQLVSLIGLVCFVFTHLRAWIPARWIAKLPVWLVKRIEQISGNYGGAKNEHNSTTDRTL